MNFIKKLLLTLSVLGSVVTTFAQVPNNYFTWDNATVYFTINDRFLNGNPANDQSYGRGKDGIGNAYTFDAVGGWHGGDLAGLTQKVNDGYFDSLGVNAIWITAPYEQIHGWVAGSNGEFQHYAYHGYYALDWTEIDANMGTAAELHTFIDAAHSRKIRVIFDIVMNHTGYNTARDMEEYGFGCINSAWRGWRPTAGQDWSGIHNYIDYTATCTTGWGNWWGANWVRSGLPGYTNGNGTLTGTLAGLPDIITESTTATILPPILLNKWDAAREAQEISELNTFLTANSLPLTPRNAIVKWLADWVREYGVDGFRVDTYKHVDDAAWTAMATHCRQALVDWKAANPSKKIDDLPFWIVAEDFGHGPGKNNTMIGNGFNAAINFNFQGIAGNPLNLESTYANYASILNPDSTWNILSYISSHDTQLFDRGDLIDGGTSLLLAPGAIQIFYGDETARPVGTAAISDVQQNTRSVMNWSSINTTVLAHWKKLGQFRKKHPAIGAGQHNRISTSPYAFTRTFSKGFVQDNVICVIGASGATALNVSSLFPNGTLLKDFYTGATATVANGTVTFTAHNNGVILIEDPNPIPRPIVSISPTGTFSVNPLTVTLSGSDPNGLATTIYYTTDATLSSSNLTAWTVYSTPISLTASGKLRAIAKNANNVFSAERSEQFYIGSIPDFKVYFKKPTAWTSNNIRCYYWNTNSPTNSMPTVGWPGATMTSCGNDWYSFTFQGTLSSNLIFNGGNNTMQTTDLSRANEGWFENSIWSDVAPVGYNGCTSSGGGTGGGGSTSTDTLDIYFYNAANWATPKMYFWSNLPNPNNTSTTWPGVTMTAVAGQTGWFKASIAGATSSNLIFSNNGASQTANLSRTNDGWYVGNNCWSNTNPLTTANDITLELTTTSWTTPYLYYWNVVPTATAVPWPGVAMTRMGTSNVYRHVLSGKHFTNFIFSNNGQNQSNDLNTCGESRAYIQGTYNTYNILGDPKINAKILLSNYDTTTGLMDNYYVQNVNSSNFPLSDPYAAAPLNSSFTHVNNSTIATITNAALSTTGNNAIVDWVFLELRNGTSGSTSVVYTKAALLQADGDIVESDGISPVQWTGVPAGNYFFAVRHRNHIGIRSANTIALSIQTPVTINLSNNAALINGNSSIFLLNPNTILLSSGDATADGSIDGTDSTVWENENGGFGDYMLRADFNLDGSIDGTDSTLWELNNGKYQELD